MSFQYNSIFYNAKIFDKGYSIESYNNLISYIKYSRSLPRIIYDKEPNNLNFHTKSGLSVSRDQHISEHNDKLIFFSASDPSQVVTIWYNEYGTLKHVSVYNGKAVILDDLYMCLCHDIMIQPNNILLYSIFCDFKYFNIPRFINKCQNKTLNLNSYYTVI